MSGDGAGHPPRRPDRLKLFFDGGCRPTPGPMEIAIVAQGQVRFHDDLGHGTHNDAEWLALIHALMLAQSLGVEACELVGDAAMVVDQANGAGRCPRALKHHLDRFKALAASGPKVRVRWIGRSKNLAGIALARRHAGQP